MKQQPPDEDLCSLQLYRLFIYVYLACAHGFIEIETAPGYCTCMGYVRKATLQGA